MRGNAFTVPTDRGELAGWVTGTGTPVLLLHGGPGMTYEYLDELADDIGPGYEVAAYQQRGLAPSTLEGPFDIDTNLADVEAVLDHLHWQMAYIVGHSWGGHLLFHVAVAMPDRLLGALAVDALGAVDDGGAELFGAEMMARCPADVRARVEELETASEAGEASDGDEMEELRLYWPAYFSDWDAAPPMRVTGVSADVYAAAFASLTERAPALEAALPSIAVPVGIVAGADSPMPLHESAEATAERIPGAWVEVVSGAGHLPWFERPGCVRAALDRLAEA